MSLQTGRVSFLSTELMEAPDTGDSLEHTEPVSHARPPLAGGEGSARSMGSSGDGARSKITPDSSSCPLGL